MGETEQGFFQLATMAFLFGTLSAVSLPLGAVLGLWLRPSDRVVAALMAFGAGALLAALSFELVEEALEKGGFTPLAIGSLIGALLFVGLNEVLNGKGAFLRKPATLFKHLRRRKIEQASEILEGLSRVQILRALPPQEIQAILPLVRPLEFASGDITFSEGDPGDALYLIDSGEVDVIRGASKTRIARLSAGDTFGEIALLTREPRTATVQAAGPLKVWTIAKEDFDRLILASPELSAAVTDLMTRRKHDAVNHGSPEEAERWHKEAVDSMEMSVVNPTALDVREAAKAHGGGAPMAIWLGIALDGIPESFVIGASLLHSSAVSAALIVGVFLANFPEAMSSAVGMSRQGLSVQRVVWMWTSLMIMTGVGAFLGNIFLQDVPLIVFALVAATAAGAMLAMIAETMLPEAFEHGGHLVGISTLLGFLAAILVRTLETTH